MLGEKDLDEPSLDKKSILISRYLKIIRSYHYPYCKTYKLINRLC
jgi:hypothetical protein